MLEASVEPFHDLKLRWGIDSKTNPMKSVPELFETLFWWKGLRIWNVSILDAMDLLRIKHIEVDKLTNSIH